ncbi:MAG: biotin/lipoyl-containing protein [Thermodesulfobacteriota bacterium]
MKRELIINGDRYQVEAVKTDGNRLSFHFDGREYHFSKRQGPAELVITENNRNHVVRCSRSSRNVQVNIGPLEAFIEVPEVSRSKKSASGGGSLKSPMPGIIFKIFAEEGSLVKAGDKILILEAMKMEHTLRANRDGRLTKIFFKEGDQVEGDVELAAIASEEKKVQVEGDQELAAITSGEETG